MSRSRSIYVATAAAMALSMSRAAQGAEITQAWIDELPPSKPGHKQQARKIKAKGGPKRKAKRRAPRVGR